jgi:translocation and assembly module TamB
VLLRSDLDLQLAQKSGEPATLSGDVRLRDSLFLQEMKSLVPGGPAYSVQRPPYFRVEEEPFADWRLNVRLRGDKALRVRTPLFRGEISGSFQLTGTLGEPVALGEARMASGRVQFPFGTLTVDQGYATLTSENPYRPALLVNASGRNYGYAIKMEVSGPADDPRVTFTSTPPLTSEQIVLMLTAGEMPRDEFSFSNQQRATRLAMFLGKDFLSRLVGDEAAAERLTIRSGENISDEGKLTYSVEYRLTDRWSVVGEYDRFNALNAGLKWKVYSK